MSENKTKANQNDVMQFLEQVGHEKRKQDGLFLKTFFEEVTGYPSVMWGSSIVGYGSYHYKYDSGREGDMCLTGFSPRKQRLSIYIMPGFEQYETLMEQLGKHKIGKSCLYVNKLEDIDLNILRQLVKESVEYMKEKYGVE